MEPLSRLFSCALCLAQCVICSSCDRGQIYCGPDCACSARKKSCKEAEQRYQRTFRGKMNHALRQRRYRTRLHDKVTDRGSQVVSPHALLVSVEKRAVKLVNRHENGQLKCCCCQEPLSNWLRAGFLQQTTRANTPTLLLFARPP